MVKADKQPFRFQGCEVFQDIRSSAPRAVPDADGHVLAEYGQHMTRQFRDKRLPAVLYKGQIYPPRELGEFVEPRGF